MNIKRILLAILLLAAAAGAAFCVKELIDIRYPVYAIPKLTVTADGEALPVSVAAFDWDFSLGGEARLETPEVSEVNPTPAILLGGETLELVFSQPLVSLEVLRSESYSYSLFDIKGDLRVPYEKGAYLYQINAVFERGNAQYYFYIVVE